MTEIDINKIGNLEIYAVITDDYGAEVKVTDSSAVQTHTWVHIKGGQVTHNDGSAHLSVQQATDLRDALDLFLVKRVVRGD